MTLLLKYDMSPSHSVLQCFRPYLYLLCMVPLSITITFKVIVVDTWPGGNFSSAHMDLRKGWFHQIHNNKYIQIWTYWFNTTFLSSMPDPLLFVSDLHLISRKAATLTQQLLFKNENFHVVLKHEKNSAVIWHGCHLPWHGCSPDTSPPDWYTAALLIPAHIPLAWIRDIRFTLQYRNDKTQS